VLDLSKIEANKLSLNIVEFQIVAVLEATLRMFDAEFKTKQIDFMLNVPDENIVIRGDPDRYLFRDSNSTGFPK